MHQQSDDRYQLTIMEPQLAEIYKQGILEFYARAVSTITILTVVVAFVLGGYDLFKLAFPSLTLNSALHEKYQNNESYTDFGTFKKELTQDSITRERTANYEKLLRMERRDAAQRLLKIGFALIAVVLLNMVLIKRYKPS